MTFLEVLINFVRIKEFLKLKLLERPIWQQQA